MVHSVSFSPDGLRLARGGYEGAILWDVEAGTPQIGIVPGGKDACAAFDYTKNQFRYYGEDSWQIVGWVGLDENGRAQWLMPEEFGEPIYKA